MTTTSSPNAEADATRETEGAGLCWECNYPLQGLPESRCPECGRAFDPSDPASMNLGRPVGRLAKLLLGRTVWFEPLAVVYVCAALACGALIPLPRLANVMLFLLGWVLIGGAYLVRSTLRSIFVKRFRQPEAAAHVDDLMNARVGRLAVAAVLLLALHVPLYLTFLASLPWLAPAGRERYEQMPYLTVNQTPMNNLKLGLFRVTRVDVSVHGARFRVNEGPGPFVGELVYAPGEEVGWIDYLFGGRLTSSWSAW